jgi:hypothetical protein
MTAPENPLLRWSRLKRETLSKDRANVNLNDQRDRAVATATTEPRPEFNREFVDPRELPAIDTITVHTDIRAFLKSRVPVELTRAALRRTWISDPVIRDFVGIAENQWDFNDPTAISGFGPLLETDDVRALLARAFGQPAELVTAMAELPMALEPPASVRQIEPPNQPDVPDGSSGIPTERAAPEHPGAEQDGSAPSKRRAHGGALPR